MQYPPALPSDHRRDQLVTAVKDNLALLFGAVAIAWGLEILDTVLLGFLDRFGIQPRSATGIVGIVTSPFLHLG